MGLLRASACLVAILMFVGAPQASAVFTYGNLNGTNVVYKFIQEDSTTDPGVQLFGAPGVAGDSLTFSPVSFGANASGAGGFDLTDGTLATTIQAINNSRVERIQFAERGDYTLAGNGTAGTNVAVAASLFIRIVELDGVGVTPITFSTNLLFNPSDGTYNLIDDRGIGVIWNGAVDIDVNAAILAAGKVGKATKVDVSLDNTLMAFSEAGTVAYIKKKQLEGVSITAIVPEPATMGLLALGALLAARRRRA